jgi:hypothetical protein
MFFREAKEISHIDCSSSADSIKFQGPSGSKFSLICDANCSKLSNKVFGDIIYSDDSYICQAAIHSGLMTDKGGEI